jgi:REP element-mobilizing transposase RayT
MRVVSAVGNMRRRSLYKAMRDATITAGLRERFRIVHISLQRDHVHMLVEADTKLALARGMQGFQISAARHINTALGADKYRRRRGPVFADRYHLEVITSPTRARRALSSGLTTSAASNALAAPAKSLAVMSRAPSAIHSLYDDAGSAYAGVTRTATTVAPRTRAWCMPTPG